MSERPATPEHFVSHLAELTRAIGAPPLDRSLEARLEQDFGAASTWFGTAAEFYRQGVADGWLCGREASGIKSGRAVAADDALNGFSVDVVEMVDIAGPHQAHLYGEIDLIMPLDDAAEFDETRAGWIVYGPTSAHAPTVTKANALVLYLLPNGAIEFTR